MKVQTDISRLSTTAGAIAFMADRQENLVPNEVVNLTFDNDWSPMHAWREHLGLTQTEVAARGNMTQGAYARWRTAPNRVAPARKR